MFNRGSGQLSKREKVKVYGSRFCWLFMVTILAIYGFAPNKLIRFELSSKGLALSLIISFLVMYLLDKTVLKKEDGAYEISNKIFELLLVIYTFGLLLLFSFLGTGESELSIFEEPLFFVISGAYFLFTSFKLILVLRKSKKIKDGLL